MDYSKRSQYATDELLTAKYNALDQRHKIQALYLWIHGSGEFMRSKTRTLDHPPKQLTDLPIWNFDGSLTGQATDKNSDVYLRPVLFFHDPFRRGNNILVLCDTTDGNMEPIPSNTRRKCVETMKKAFDHNPRFGMEQEYTILDLDRNPLGWSNNETLQRQGPSYCGVGANRVYGRDIAEAHYRACLYADIKIAGFKAKAMPAQWEYQIGPHAGVQAADHLWISRYILQRVAEDYGVIVTLDPKAVPGDYRAGRCHCTMSTTKMREEGGYKEILDAIDKLSKVHYQHIGYYDRGGKDNEQPSSILHRTEKIDAFSYGVGDRTASVRIPRRTYVDQCGYFEDRRPLSNCDPYSVITALAKTVCLEGEDRKLSMTYMPSF